MEFIKRVCFLRLFQEDSYKMEVMKVGRLTIVLTGNPEVQISQILKRWFIFGWRDKVHACLIQYRKWWRAILVFQFLAHVILPWCRYITVIVTELWKKLIAQGENSSIRTSYLISSRLLLLGAWFSEAYWLFGCHWIISDIPFPYYKY